MPFLCNIQQGLGTTSNPNVLFGVADSLDKAADLCLEYANEKNIGDGDSNNASYTLDRIEEITTKQWHVLIREDEDDVPENYWLHTFLVKEIEMNELF